jgi:leucyl aminopeptidase
VTFDSGGINLKPSRHIETMKCDMAGAAAVLGLMKLLPVIQPGVIVDGYIPTAENMVDGKAHKPGDVVKSRNGKTVEIINTDGEGRLLLADAIDYAIQKKPDALIDLATLTGSVRYALGEIYTAILGNDQKLINKVIDASKEAGEPTWQLPLVKEYLKGYVDGIADLNNVGKTFAGTISGALFLHEFVGKTKWAHLDIAETAWTEEDRNYRTKGGTGAGIQTLVKFLQKY